MPLKDDFLDNIDTLLDDSPRGRLLQQIMKLRPRDRLAELADEKDKAQLLQSEVLLKKLAASPNGMFCLADLLGLRSSAYIGGFWCPRRERKYGMVYLGDPLVMSEWPLTWRLTYVVRRFAFVDPAMWAAIEKRGPVLWRSADFDGRAKQFGATAIRYGLHEGVTTFVQGDSTEVALGSWVASKTCTADFLWQHIDGLQFFFNEFHRYAFVGQASKVARQVQPIYTEQQVLSMLCHGVGDSDIAKALGVSMGRLDATILTLYAKLGVSDRRELIRRAEIFGFGTHHDHSNEKTLN